MYRKIITLIALISLLLTACGSTDQNPPKADSTLETSAVSEINSSEKNNADVDEGLRVVLAEIKDMARPGEAGASLKSAQAAADALDFALGTDLDAETLGTMTQAYCASLSKTSADIFPEQLQLIAETISILQTNEGESLLEDAGITDSSYPWTDEAFSRVAAITGSL